MPYTDRYSLVHIENNRAVFCYAGIHDHKIGQKSRNSIVESKIYILSLFRTTFAQSLFLSLEKG